MTGSMVVKDPPVAIESILCEEDLVRIQKEFNIMASIRLELLGSFEKVTMGSATRVALYEVVFRARLRLPLPIVIIELLR